MAKKECTLCGKSVGVFSRTKIADGIICSDCFKKSRIRTNSNMTKDWTFTVDQIRKTINGEILPESPIEYSMYGHKVFFNRAAGTWLVETLFFSSANYLNDVVSYEYVENDKKYSVTKTIGAAAIVGVLFGGAGAIVGGLIGNNQHKKIVKAEFHVVEEVNGHRYKHRIPLVKSDDLEVKVGTASYDRLMETVKGIAAEFDRAINGQYAYLEK